MNLSIFFKGILMGICDVIPGISGGTIAFITGIYSRLISAIKNISPELFKNCFSYLYRRDAENLRKLQQSIKKADLGFLLILGAGIFTAIFGGSKLIKFFLDNFFVYTITFFIGLILASSKIIYDKIKNHHINNILFGIVGILCGILLAGLAPLAAAPSCKYVFLGGFLAVSAMFLPGISGAFILLIMGLYEFMIDVIHHLDVKSRYLFAFACGAGLGAFTISRIIVFLFSRDKCKTLYFLLGLVIGSLSIPVKKIFYSGIAFNLRSIFFIFIMFTSGMILVFIVRRLEKPH